ncbi:MAG: ethanolamine ammonia-lyase subunit EutC [Nevskia sp.]
MSREPADPGLPLPADEGDAWLALRRHTPARIALGRSGASLTTRALLAFGIAHAQARDAVAAALDIEALDAALRAIGVQKTVHVCSGAADRAAYLARPDWGRRLSPSSRQAIAALRGETPPDVVFALSDGLSATAVQRQAAAFVEAVLPRLEGLAVAPLVIATQARVALADDIGEQLGARIAVSLIGERPGLSAADSLGVYLTYAPKPGRTDAERNCLSNVRPEGLPPAEAARQAAELIRVMLARRLSGVALRYEGSAAPALR